MIQSRILLRLATLAPLAALAASASASTWAPAAATPGPVARHGPVLFVDAAASAGGSGVSWGDAFQDLQDALAAASLDGSVRAIWVAAGTYVPTATLDPTISFELVDGVAVFGGFAGNEVELDQRDVALNPTILSGDLAGDDQPKFLNYGENSNHVVVARGVGTATILDGFTIRGGNARIAEPAGFVGGGLYLTNASPVLRNLTVDRNRTTKTSSLSALGAGLYAMRAAELTIEGSVFSANGQGRQTDAGGGCALVQSTAEVRACVFSHNGAREGGGVYSTLGQVRVADTRFETNNATAGGGLSVVSTAGASLVERCSLLTNDGTSGPGIYVESTSPRVTVRDCVFDANTGTTGIGVYVREADDVLVERCTFQNSRFTAGGGIYVSSQGAGPRTTIRGCVFRDNKLHANAGSGRLGGGVGVAGGGNSGPLVTIEDSLFYQNQLKQVGVTNGGSAVLDRCTIYRPIAGAGVNAQTRSSLQLTNCIVWNPFGVSGLEATGSGSVVASRSCIAGGAPGAGNISDDPRFVDAAAGDFRLLASSPCIDAGDPAALPAGLDLDGEPRLLDGDLDGSLIVDIGADEHAPIQLAIASAGPGSIVVSTSGVSGLVTTLFAGTPGPGVLQPGAGFLFLDPNERVRSVAWATTPSSVSVALPEGLALPIQVQVLGTNGTGQALSNPVLLPASMP